MIYGFYCFIIHGINSFCFIIQKYVSTARREMIYINFIFCNRPLIAHSGVEADNFLFCVSVILFDCKVEQYKNKINYYSFNSIVFV